eukprot:6218223-Alexandrium_andersonii.AAC.1
MLLLALVTTPWARMTAETMYGTVPRILADDLLVVTEADDADTPASEVVEAHAEAVEATIAY